MLNKLLKTLIFMNLFIIIIFLNFMYKEETKISNSHSYSNSSPYYMKFRLSDYDKTQLKKDFKNEILKKYSKLFSSYKDKYLNTEITYEKTKIDRDFKFSIYKAFQEIKGSLIYTLDEELTRELKEILLEYEFKK